MTDTDIEIAREHTSPYPPRGYRFVTFGELCVVLVFILGVVPLLAISETKSNSDRHNECLARLSAWDREHTLLTAFASANTTDPVLRVLAERVDSLFSRPRC